jgi:hypothetical protein
MSSFLYQPYHFTAFDIKYITLQKNRMAAILQLISITPNIINSRTKSKPGNMGFKNLFSIAATFLQSHFPNRPEGGFTIPQSSMTAFQILLL